MPRPYGLVKEQGYKGNWALGQDSPPSAIEPYYTTVRGMGDSPSIDPATLFIIAAAALVVLPHMFSKPKGIF